MTRTIEQAQEAIEQGFQYVTDLENAKLWRARKIREMSNHGRLRWYLSKDGNYIYLESDGKVKK